MGDATYDAPIAGEVQGPRHGGPHAGISAPSRADIEMTREIVAAAKALHIAVHDHLVVGHGGTASFKTLGLM